MVLSLSLAGWGSGQLSSSSWRSGNQCEWWPISGLAYGSIKSSICRRTCIYGCMPCGSEDGLCVPWQEPCSTQKQPFEQPSPCTVKWPTVFSDRLNSSLIRFNQHLRLAIQITQLHPKGGHNSHLRERILLETFVSPVLCLGDLHANGWESILSRTVESVKLASAHLIWDRSIYERACFWPSNWWLTWIAEPSGKNHESFRKRPVNGGWTVAVDLPGTSSSSLPHCETICILELEWVVSIISTQLKMLHVDYSKDTRFFAVIDYVVELLCIIWWCAGNVWEFGGRYWCDVTHCNHHALLFAQFTTFHVRPLVRSKELYASFSGA